MTTALIIVGSVVFYTFMAGVLAVVLRNSREARCVECRKDVRRCYYDHAVAECIGSLGWPVILPAFIGVYAASWWAGRGERAEKRREKERAEYEELRKKERVEYEKARDIIREAGIDWPEVDWPVVK